MDYAQSAATATRLLTKFGRLITLRQVATPVYDPATGAATGGTVDLARQGVLLNYGAGETVIAGTLVQSGDKRLLLEPLTTPTPKDRIIAGGVEYVILSIAELNPAGTPILFDCHLRV